MLSRDCEAHQSKALACGLLNLQNIHKQLVKKFDGPCTEHYALEVGCYLRSELDAVNRQGLVQAIVDQCQDDPRVVPIAYEMVFDREVMADYHAMACDEACDQALTALCEICNRHLPKPLHANPIADDKYISLAMDGHVTEAVKDNLNNTEQSISVSHNDVDEEKAISQLNYAGRILLTIQKAFQAAAVVLLSFDIEGNMAALMLPEIEAEISCQLN